MKRNNNVIRRQPNKNRRGGRKTQVPKQRGRLSLAPVAIGRDSNFINPVVKSNYLSCRVSHREMIGTVSGTVNFTNTSYVVNPGNQITFPWLSKMARNWEKYRFRKLSFVFLTRAPTSQTGSVMLAPDYDSVDTAPSTSSQMFSYLDNKESVVWKDLTCNISQVRNGMDRFVLSGSQPSNTDIKMYNVANFNIATEGNTAAVIGRLFVDYDVELKIPQLPSPGEDAPSGSMWSAGSVTTNLLGLSPGSYGLLNMSNSLNVVTVNNLVVGGEYIFSLYVIAAVVTTEPTIAATSGFTSKTDQTGVINVAGTVAYETHTMIATATSGTITLGGITVLTNPTLVQLIGSLYLPFAY